MRLAVVGVGNAGSRIANRILDVERATGRTLTAGNTLLVNATPPAFDVREHVPEERRLVVGDVYGALDGGGTDGDPDLGREVALEERNELNRAFDLLAFHEVHGVLVTAGLAGGIGGGAGAVVIDQLQQVSDVPVYAVGALPAAEEGPEAALAAARSLRSFVERADAVLPFDDEEWREEEVEAESYRRSNGALAHRLVTLFGAGEVGGGAVPDTRVDPSDVIRTLDVGGVATIGYAATEVPSAGGPAAWLRALRDALPWTPERETAPTDAAKINRLVRRAAHSRLTVPCSIESADRALIVLSGPARALSRKGFESGRYWLEEEAGVVEVMAGDEPHDRTSTLTAVVLLSNVTDVPRIDAMQAQAIEGTPTASTDGGMQFGDPDP